MKEKERQKEGGKRKRERENARLVPMSKPTQHRPRVAGEKALPRRQRLVARAGT